VTSGGWSDATVSIKPSLSLLTKLSRISQEGFRAVSVSPQPETSQRITGRLCRFAGCEFDEARRELRVRGKAVDPEAKPLEVLRQLLLHPGEVVTKEELLESVWPDVSVVEGSLTNAISKLRKALGDDRVIVTIARVGYRVDVPVQTFAPSSPRSTHLALAAGEAVPGRDQWTLVQRLNHSPSNEVWLAEHPRTHELRVFKFAADEARLSGLKREVTLARLLAKSLGNRPEFVRILEWNFETAPYYLESEYAGPNLAEWADSLGGLRQVPLAERLRLMSAIAGAVAFAHELGVLHKDLKPANILVHRGAEGWEIKIADFGSGWLQDPAVLDALGITNLGFTQNGESKSSLLGTALYVAPELLLGQSPSPAADMYALGVLLYQMAAGDFRKPLAPGWEQDIADPALRQDISEAACGDPVRRLSSASELSDRLRHPDRPREPLFVEPQPGHRIRRGWWFLAGAACLVVAAVAAWWLRPRANQQVDSVAVLPFRNLRNQAESDFLRLALADEVVTTLSHIRGFEVRPTPAGRYEKPGYDLQQAGREMHVSNVVTGDFARSGDQLHITLEAVDVRTGRIRWRDEVDAPASSMIAAQAQVTLRVRGGLARVFGRAPTGTAAQPKNEQAYDLFLRSFSFPLDPSDNRKALAMLETATKLDPDYPPASIALARRYYVESRYGDGNPELMRRYDAVMEHAVSLDPDYVPAAAGLIVSRVERGDLPAAYVRASALVRRRPDSADAHFSLSYVLRFAGLLRDSARECDAAFLLDARTPTSGLLSCALVFIELGDYPRALNYLQINPDSQMAKAFAIDVLVRQGNGSGALRLGSPRIPQWPTYDLLLDYLAGKPASKIAREAAAIRPLPDPEADYLAAGHLAYSGQTALAIDFLRRAIAGGYCSYPAIDQDPLLVKARAMPEYRKIQSDAMTCRRNFLTKRR
jgi:serine/threonine protein kinase